MYDRVRRLAALLKDKIGISGSTHRHPLPLKTKAADLESEEIILKTAEKILNQCDKLGIQVLTLEDPGYPENLRTIPDPPSVIFVKGEIIPSDRLSVAIVGTRKASSLGKAVAFEMAQDLAAAGVTVVSGLALGIDTSAHKGALSQGGRTVACLGGGLDVIYPRENGVLFKTIPESGALISQYPPGTKPLPWHFPARNRLISGMALGVVVVEAGKKSGALITCDWALKQGRPVMAVPGSVKSKNSCGTNKLIQEGAYLVTNAQDVLSFLRQENEYIPEYKQSLPIEKMSLEEAMLFETLKGEALSLDEISEKVTFFPIQKIISLVSSLELKGMARQISGGKYVFRSKSFSQKQKGRET